MIAGDQPTSAQQVCHTRLMSGGGKLPIGRPAITDQDPVEVRAKHRGGLGEAAARLNPIDRRVGRRKSPEPLQVPADFPARFIGAHHRAAAHRRTPGVVRGSGLPRGAMYGMHQPTRVRPYRCCKSVTILPNDSPSCLLSTTTSAITCGPSCAAAAPMASDVCKGCAWTQWPHRSQRPTWTSKLADHHARDRQLFLILVDDTGLHHRPGTVGTMRGERRVVALIHARGTSPTRLGSIRTAGLPPWSLRMRLQRFRKWGRLPEAGSPRLVHLSFQMIDLLAQPIVLSLEAIMLALRLVALALGAFRPFSQVFDLTSGPIVQGWVA